MVGENSFFVEMCLKTLIVKLVIVLLVGITNNDDLVILKFDLKDIFLYNSKKSNSRKFLNT